MEEIGTQVALPFRRAFKISVSGIRIRLGRSMVTISGVVLGIAFLMSNLTGQLVKKAISSEREQRQTVDLMMSLVKAEAGTIEGKRVAAAAFGELTDLDMAFLKRVLKGKPSEFKGMGIDLAGISPTPAADVGRDASVFFVLGNSQEVPVSLVALTEGMLNRTVLDSEATRTYVDGSSAEVRRELFFGAAAEAEQAEMANKARQERFRILWIVGVSLLVTIFTVANALLMSVTERFREIGTMKCLGALSKFIRTLFLIESSLIGLAGSILGAIVGALATMIIYGISYDFATVFGSVQYSWLLLAGLGSATCGTIMSVLAAIYPARVASKMVPADALRSTV